MKRLVSVFMAVALLFAGCHKEPVVNNKAGKKVADQLLNSYSPVRRLTYRDACGGDGALTVCVERISISDSATLVEVRVRNGNRFSYVLGGPGGRVFLADADGETIAGDRVSERQLEPGEVPMLFRMSGRLRGEPVLLTLQGIERPPMLEPPYQAGKRASLEVRLAG
jgi:hypothetical protein